MLQTHTGFPENAAADQCQRNPENQSRCRFDPGMTIRMRLVSRMRALATGVDDEEIRQQIRKGMEAVRNQRLRMRQPADDQLGDRHYQIDCDTDPGRPLCDGRTLGGRLTVSQLLSLLHLLCPILLGRNSTSRPLWES